jgi:hypothetical protein
MKCDYCGHRLCCCHTVLCPLIIIGPGLRPDELIGPGITENTPQHKEAEAKRRKEFQEDLEKRLESFFKQLEKDRPEAFKKIMLEKNKKHKPRYNIVEEIIPIPDGYDGIGEI